MIINDFINYDKSRPTAICLGGFDSMHSGHISIIERARDYAAVRGDAVAVTAFHYEDATLKKASEGEVFTFPERIDIFKDLSVDEMIKVNFNRSFSMLTPTEFLDKIFDNRLIDGVFCGVDFRFGKDGAGDALFLKRYCEERGVKYYILPFVTFFGKKVSTTTIKQKLSEGEVKACYLRYRVKYFIKGEVVKGRMEGRKIGFPTANIIPPASKYPLKSGVYECTVKVDNETYKAIANLGDAPTFGVKDRVLECHLLDFDKDIYGKTINVYFDDRLRDIIRFRSVESLKKQIQRDIKEIRGL